MKKNAKLMVVFIVLIVIAAILGYVWVNGQIRETEIYEWSRSIQFDETQNYKVAEGDLQVARLMQADVKEDYITDPAAIVGKYLTRDVSAGSPVVSGQLSPDPIVVMQAEANEELAEMRKYYLSVNGYGDTFAGDISAGDVVDLLFMFNNSGMTDEQTKDLDNASSGIEYANAKIFMQNLSVYQVYDANGEVYTKKITDPLTLNRYQQTGGLYGGPNEEAQKEIGSPAYVALAVTPEQYEEIATRQKLGKVSLVSRYSASQDKDTEGYILIKTSGAKLYAGNGILESDPELLLNSEVKEEKQPAAIRPALYTFIKDFAKINMNEEERTKYNSIYTRLAEYMTALNGTEWEVNSPQDVTLENIQSSIDTEDTAAVNAFFTFKNDVASLARELRGNDVILPWS